MGKLGLTTFGLTQDQAIGHLAMLVFSALVAGSFSLGSMAAPHIDPAALNAARFWLGAGLLSTIAVATGRFDRRAFVAPWRFLILGGLFGIYFVMMFEGLKTAPPVSAAAVFTLTPIVTGLAAWVLLRQVMTFRIAAALAIGGAGAVWVIFRADLNAILNFQIGKGEITYFWGCVSHAIYTPMVRKLNRGENPIIFTVGMLIAGGIILSIYGGPAILATDWSALPLIVWITLAYTRSLPARRLLCCCRSARCGCHRPR